MAEKKGEGGKVSVRFFRDSRFEMERERERLTSDETVLGDVLEVTSVLEPRSSGRDVIGG